MTQKIKVAIFGSCVSRDPFENQKKFEITEYYARSSLASMTSDPITTTIDLSVISSEFQRRMIYRDFNKDFKIYLAENNFDILLVDFTDDRFPIIELPDKTLITESNEFAQANKNNKDLLPSNHIRIKPFSEDFFNIWRNGFLEIIRISKLHKFTEKILINCTFWSRHDDNNKEFKNIIEIELANKYFRKIYDFCHQHLKPNQFINYEPNQLIGFSKHKWGSAPFHFTSKVEKTCLEQVIKHHETCATYNQ